MVLSNETEADLDDKHSELCSKLNIDHKITNDAWDRFQSISKNFTLEGEPLHWLGCAIYVSCWRNTAPSAQGNCVNLTSLLRHCNLSIAQFFFKIKQWNDMANMPDEFKKRIEYLEGNFAVAYNVFKEYQPLFLLIFKAPEIGEADLMKQHRNRKQKSVPCTTLKIFEFCWTLFITIKGEDTNYNNDLVTSCHLLITICDWAFKNAFLADRRDLLNPEFKGLPSEWCQSGYATPPEAPCVVSYLCPSFNMITDVKYIKEYQFKKSLRNLFEQGALTGRDRDTDIFDSSVFEQNYKHIANTYEANFLNKSDFDERIFLAEYRRKLIVREQNISGQNAEASSPDLSKDMVVSQECLTPLTGRKYLGPKESHDSTPLVTATESISRLNSLLHGRRPAPSDDLVQLFESCTRNPTERINEIVTNLGERFVNAHTSEQREVTTRRLQLAITLFYKFIENILQNEKQMQSDISAIVEKDVFYECIFTCCLEIVIYSYNSRQRFPWILEALQIQPYNFVKVIELIIRSKDKLSRDTIKHLNMIEEMILSSLAWKSESLIWQAITSSDKEVPKFEETALPGHLQNETSSESSTLRSILNSEPRPIQSPGPSATDRFQSPVAHSSALNRELFPTVQSSQPMVTPTHLMIKDRTGNTRIVVVKDEAQKVQPVVQAPVVTRRPDNPLANRPKRTGGVSIIFRKFYNLSGERMEHLCTHLKITNTDTKRKIWTVFEELVRKNHCELMKDRNLDQLLMCAIYMICKLTQLSKSFAEIIKSYRTQPQATSDIYRKVLINGKKSEVVEGATVEIPEERGDLILFYNNVIIRAMKKFAEKFVVKGDDQNGDILLSPLPASRGQVVQVLDNIYIKPLESPTMLGNGKVLNYYFSRSPSKDLKNINKAIKGNGVTGKRLLVEGENELPNTKRIANRKVQSLIEERRNQNTE